MDDEPDRKRIRVREPDNVQPNVFELLLDLYRTHYDAFVIVLESLVELTWSTKRTVQPLTGWTPETVDAPYITNYQLYDVVRHDIRLSTEFLRVVQRLHPHRPPLLLDYLERHSVDTNSTGSFKTGYFKEADDEHTKLSAENALRPYLGQSDSHGPKLPGAVEDLRSLASLMIEYFEKKLTKAEEKPRLEYLKEVAEPILSGSMKQPAARPRDQWMRLFEAYVDGVPAKTDMSKLAYAYLSEKDASRLFSTRTVAMPGTKFLSLSGIPTRVKQTLFAATLYHNLYLYGRSVLVTPDNLPELALLVAPFYTGANERIFENVRICVNDQSKPLMDMDSLPSIPGPTPTLSDVLSRMPMVTFFSKRGAVAAEGPPLPLFPPTTRTMFPAARNVLHISNGITPHLWPGCAHELQLSSSRGGGDDFRGLHLTNERIIERAMAVQQDPLSVEIRALVDANNTVELDALCSKIREKHETRIVRIKGVRISQIGNAGPVQCLYIKHIDQIPVNFTPSGYMIDNVSVVSLEDVKLPQMAGVHTELRFESQSLSTLTLSEIDIYNSVHVIIANCPSLKAVDISGCDKVSIENEPAEDATYEFESIETVRFCGSKHITSLEFVSVEYVTITRNNGGDTLAVGEGASVEVSNVENLVVHEGVTWPITELIDVTLGWLYTMKRVSGILEPGMHPTFFSNAKQLVLKDVTNLQHMPMYLPHCTEFILYHKMEECFNGEDPFIIPYMPNLRTLTINTEYLVEMAPRIDAPSFVPDVTGSVKVLCRTFRRITDLVKSEEGYDYMKRFCHFTETFLRTYKVMCDTEDEPADNAINMEMSDVMSVLPVLVDETNTTELQLNTTDTGSLYFEVFCPEIDRSVSYPLELKLNLASIARLRFIFAFPVQTHTMPSHGTSFSDRFTKEAEPLRLDLIMGKNTESSRAVLLKPIH